MTTAAAAFVWFLGLYWVGAVIAGYVFRIRAGLGASRRLHTSGPGGVGVVWMALTLLKAFGWPLVLVFWLANDKPEPRIVFNDNAVAAQARGTAEARRRAHASARPALVDPPTVPIRIPAGGPRPQARPLNVGHHAVR